MKSRLVNHGPTRKRRRYFEQHEVTPRAPGNRLVEGAATGDHLVVDITAASPLHRTRAELEAKLDWIRGAPSDRGRLELIVRRPAVDERELLAEGVLDREVGLVGDSWRSRPSSSSPDGGPHPDRQLTLINARVAALVAGSPERMALAGDQLFVDLDLSIDNAPAGTRLAIGTGTIEITEPPHLGCAKFIDRFGQEAMRLVNSAEGRVLRLRGANARVVTGGVVRVGDTVTKEVG